ncbi:MAG: radical SAM protein [Candidatus Omnitrophica bacterium]|nr:radical SAM protein [Candidatus Omnitrophota bacterium]
MDCSGIDKVSYEEFSNRIHEKAIKERLPIEGTLEVTLRCNLRCRHCYCYSDPHKKEMGLREICGVLDEITEAGCLWLLVTGGEPLLRPDFLEIYTYAKKKGLIITLFTNATLITPYLADYLKDYPPFQIEISLYGITSHTYEQVTGIKGSFKDCQRGIELLLERKVPFKLKTTVTTLNKEELFQIKEYAEGLGVDFRFDPIINPRLDGSRQPCSFRLSPEEVIDLDLKDEARHKDWLRFCQQFSQVLNPQQLFLCHAGLISFHIDAYGQLQICSMLRSFSYDLLKGSFQEGFNNFLFKLRNQRYAFNERCLCCEVAYICDQCPGWSWLENKDLSSPIDYLCQIAHLRHQVFLRKEEAR